MFRNNLRNHARYSGLRLVCEYFVQMATFVDASPALTRARKFCAPRLRDRGRKFRIGF